MHDSFVRARRALRDISYNDLDEADIGYEKLVEAEQLLGRLPRLTSHEDPQQIRPSIMRFFTYDHLPERLREPSKAVAELASDIGWTYNSRSPEYLEHNRLTTSSLRLVLEAKDCFVRALLS